MYKNCIKRLLDIFISLVGVLAFAVSFVFVAPIIWLTDKGPVFYNANRIGQNGKLFKMYKFRSMEVQQPKEERGAWTVQDDPRVTPIGKIIRRTSIDELPQLFNVLKGDMSLVGPRPERAFFVDKFKEEIPRYMVKHQVRPGLTGWAQINGRDELEIPVKAKLDGEYVAKLHEGKGFAMDIRCFFGTISNVLQHKGVVEGGTGAMQAEKK